MFFSSSNTDGHFMEQLARCEYKVREGPNFTVKLSVVTAASSTLRDWMSG